MKKLRFLSLALISASMVFLLTACPGSVEPGAKGDKGDTGPQGPQGVAGPQGPAGTANVIYSAWYTPTSWQTRTSFNNLIQSYNDRSVAAITDAIINQGVVVVYAKLNGYANSFDLFNKVVQLPYNVLYSPSTNEYDFWAFRATSGNLRITFENNKNTYSSGGISTAYQFRYVIIPGGVSGGRKAAIDYSNYEEVKAYYNLPD